MGKRSLCPVLHVTKVFSACNVRQGDPRSVAELREALVGHDAVVSALGPPGLGWTTVLRDGARTTVAAMQAKACGDC
jgi:stage III sporulation protein SpoIIIAA